MSYVCMNDMYIIPSPISSTKLKPSAPYTNRFFIQPSFGGIQKHVSGGP